MKIVLLLIIFLLLAFADKFITTVNINQAKRNFPNANPLNIEKNPLARYFFTKLGIIGGSIIYGILSVISMFIAFYLLRIGLNESLSLYFIFIVYGIVILNNLFFLLKFSRIIP